MIETITPAEMIAPPAAPQKRLLASASGLVELASSGSVPMQTICINM